MGTEFSTDDAYDGTYDSLEDRCFQEDIDYERSVGKSIRLREWQNVAIKRIKQRSGTNLVQVAYSAYNMGLKRTRDIVDISRVNDLGDIADNNITLLTSTTHDGIGENERFSMITEGEIPDPVSHHGLTNEPRRLRFVDSALSEVEDTYMEDARFGGWIHRLIISMGLGQASTLNTVLRDKTEECERAFDGAYEKARYEEEEIFASYLNKSATFWFNNGILSSQLEVIRETMDMLETQHKNEAQNAMNIVEEHCEVIDDE